MPKVVNDKVQSTCWYRQSEAWMCQPAYSGVRINSLPMKRILTIFHLGLLLAFADAEAAEPRANRPNVVILLTDDQGTLDVNCYGSRDLMTPNMDRISASGLRFTQAYAHTVCCPARAALLTGRYPQRGGVVHWTTR